MNDAIALAALAGNFFVWKCFHLLCGTGASSGPRITTSGLRSSKMTNVPAPRARSPISVADKQSHAI